MCHVTVSPLYKCKSEESVLDAVFKHLQSHKDITKDQISSVVCEITVGSIDIDLLGNLCVLENCLEFVEDYP